MKRGSVYLVLSFPWIIHPVITRCFRYRYGQISMRDDLLFVCSGFINSWLLIRNEKYLLWNTRTSWSKRVRSFLILLYPFLNRPFYPDTYRTSLWTVIDFPSTFFFYFYNTCLFLTFRNSSDVARRNIFHFIAVWVQSPFATKASN